MWTCCPSYTLRRFAIYTLVFSRFFFQRAAPHTTHTTQASDSSVSVSRVSFGQNSAVAMNGERDCSGAGSARRRRERRQRSWLRHEQLSVKMALSAAAHLGPELREAPRGTEDGQGSGGGGPRVERRP